jgi:hypothetical protein
MKRDSYRSSHRGVLGDTETPRRASRAPARAVTVRILGADPGIVNPGRIGLTRGEIVAGTRIPQAGEHAGFEDSKLHTPNDVIAEM